MSIAENVRTARDELDAHVRETVAWHFSPDTGCPFWLEFAEGLDFDPRSEIGGFADLRILGHFHDDWLRGGPVRRWIPRGSAGKRTYVFETGGSTGVPKYRISQEDFQIDYEMFSRHLSNETFPRGADWLMLGPTGPRRLRLAVEYLCQIRGGICFLVDLDPRWVNKLIARGALQELDLYKAHVIDQALTILRANDNVKCMFTTPKLLEAICEKISLKKAGISGIFCGGTEMDAQFNRFAREELVPGIDFVPTYGNTLMGLACSKPLEPSDNFAVTYYPPVPRAVIELVDPENPDVPVEYGAVGRVMLTTLTREFFMPRFLERDEGVRAEPIEAFPWDGVRNLGLFSELQESVVVGVY